MKASSPDSKGTSGSYRPRPCPICKKLSLAQYRPFCSARCKQIDLNRWLSGGYSVPAIDQDDGDFEQSE